MEIAGFGAQIKIRTVPDINVSDYVIGAGLGNQYPSSNSVTLTIDKAKSFNAALSLVDQRQADVDLPDLYANEGSIRLRIAADTDMLATIPAQTHASNRGRFAGADSAAIDLGDSTTPLQITKTNVVDFIVDCGTVLDEQNISDEGRWMVLPPWVIAMVMKSDLRIASLAGDGVSILRNGKIGEISNFTIYRSRSLLTQTSPGAAWYVMFGHSTGLSFAAQIVEAEMLQNPNDFGYLIRGLMVYGFQTINSTAIGTAVIKR